MTKMNTMTLTFVDLETQYHVISRVCPQDCPQSKAHTFCQTNFILGPQVIYSNFFRVQLLNFGEH